MKSFSTIAWNGPLDTDGIYSPLRSEGRFCVNIASGFSLDNKSCFILPHMFLRRNYQQQNISIVRDMQQVVDIGLIFSNCDQYWRLAAKRTLLMTHSLDYYKSYKHVFDKVRSEVNAHVVTCMSTAFSQFKKENLDCLFMPTVFPIPSYQKGFSPLKKLESKTLNIFVQDYFQIAEPTIWTSSFLLDIQEILENMGFTVQFTIQTRFPNNFENFNATLISRFLDYGELYDEIQVSDLGMVFTDGGSAGGSQFDFISLGIPTLFFTNGGVGENFISPFYYHINEMFMHYSGKYDKNDLTLYLRNFMDNYESIYFKFRDVIEDYNFDNWKVHMSKLLEVVEN